MNTKDNLKIPKILFSMQEELDTRIAHEKHLKNEDVITERILAALVELGEFTNEWRGFKFWSNNKESNTRAIDIDKIGIERIKKGEITNLEPYIENPMLEEYVDVLHFILSIGNHLNMSHISIDLNNHVTEKDTHKTILEVFNDLSGIAKEIETIDQQKIKNNSTLNIQKDYRVLFNRYIQLGVHHLNYTVDDIVQAYFDKNEINYERQNNGY